MGYMVIRNKMPAKPVIDPNASATEHAKEIGGFTAKLTQWFTLFAQNLVEYWKTNTYKRGRETSGVCRDRNQRGRVGSLALQQSVGNSYV